MRDVKVAFGQRLRDLRTKKNISQEALAHKAGLDRTYLSGVERGKRNISLENIEKLARALSINIKGFFD